MINSFLVSIRRKYCKFTGKKVGWLEKYLSFFLVRMYRLFLFCMFSIATLTLSERLIVQLNMYVYIVSTSIKQQQKTSFSFRILLFLSNVCRKLDFCILGWILLHLNCQLLGNNIPYLRDIKAILTDWS